MCAKYDNHDDGSFFTTISDSDGNTATFCSVPKNHERNRTVEADPAVGPLAVQDNKGEKDNTEEEDQ